MENETGTANPSNSENPHADLESLDAAALKELVIKTRSTSTELETKNRQLFERAKKAEGFDKDEEGNWIKVIEKPKVGRPAKDEPKAEPKQSDGLDYGTKAYLRAEGINSDEFGFVQEQMEQSGLKDIEQLLNNGYFKAQLQARRDKVAVENAIPTGTRGSGENPKSSADYWIQKGEMPENTPENTQLRRDIVNKRVELEKMKNQFSSNPIVTQI